MKKILIMGLPGSGKGTQAEKIVEEYGVIHISTGEIFREAIQQKTQMGLEASKYINQGKLVPDDITIGIVKDRLTEKDCMDNGFLLDGFPRTIAQAEALENMLEKINLKIDIAIYLNTNEEVLMNRLTGRRICPKDSSTYHIIFNPPIEEGKCNKCSSDLITREDDNEKSILKRMDVAKEQTLPVVEFYKNLELVKEISLDGTPSEIFEEIKKIWNKG